MDFLLLQFKYAAGANHHHTISMLQDRTVIPRSDTCRVARCSHNRSIFCLFTALYHHVKSLVQLLLLASAPERSVPIIKLRIVLHLGPTIIQVFGGFLLPLFLTLERCYA